ncbi:hypothetical protein DUNSADRAFT_6082, partial [Dunaliella salina]
MLAIPRGLALWLVLSLSAFVRCGASAATADASLHHPARPRGRMMHEGQYMHPEDFGYSHLRFDVHYADNLFLLGLEPSILAVDCTLPGHLHLSVSDTQEVLSWEPGTLLVGDKSHGCVADGKEQPLYRFVESVEELSVEDSQQEQDYFPKWQSPQITEYKTIRVKTTEASLVNCFQFADIYYRRLPIGHNQHPIYPNSTSSADPKDRAVLEQRRQLLGTWGVDYNPTLEIMSINSDGNGGAENPELPILSDGSNQIICKDCFASLSVGFTFALRIDYWFIGVGLDYFEVSVDGEFVWSAGADVAVADAFNGGGSNTLAEEYMGKYTIYVFFIPIKIDFSTRMGVSVDVDASTGGSLSAGMSYTRGVKWGVMYRPSSGFRRINENYENYEYKPMTITFPGGAIVEIEFHPELLIEFWKLIPVTVGPRATLRMDIGPGVQSCTDFGYEFSYEISFVVGVGRIIITLPEVCLPWWLGGFCVGGWNYEFASSWLPWEYDFVLIPMTVFDGDGASGCLTSLGSLTATSLDAIEEDSIRVKWRTGEWSQCSTICGGGTIQRVVTCVDKGDSSVELDDMACSGLNTPKPSSEETCHDFPCTDEFPYVDESNLQYREDVCVYDTVPIHEGYRERCRGYCYYTLSWAEKNFYNANGVQSRCTFEMYYNTKCDEECNTDRCNRDNGSCDAEDADITACKDQMDCASCLSLEDTNCGWCASSNTCHAGTISGPKIDGSCEVESWKADTCVEKEADLEVEIIAEGLSFDAGQEIEITWSGGDPDGEVTLSLSESGTNGTKYGFGLPSEGIPTVPRSYIWQIPCSLKVDSSYAITIQSSTLLDNVAASPIFNISERGTTAGVEDSCPTWWTSSWTDCSRECGTDGVQSRRVVCLENAGSVDEQEVSDDRCTVAKPRTSRSCNVQECVDQDISIKEPKPLAFFSYASETVIKWQGGQLYGYVMIESKQVSSGITGTVNDTFSGWEQDALGIPSILNNTGSFEWSIPAGIESGKYSLRITSCANLTDPVLCSDSSNKFTMRKPFSIQALRRYSLITTPWDPNPQASLGSFTHFNGAILGTKGSGDFELHADAEKTAGVNAWAIEAVDVGSISGLRISPSGGNLTMGSIAVWNGRFTKVGLSKTLEEGEVVTRSTCEQKVTCGECTHTEGCAFCAATAKCMPSADLYSQGPAMGWCPSASWTTEYEQCGDSCHTVNTCSACLSTIGCGWCAETCTCMSRFAAGDYFDVTSKDTTSVSGCSSGWLGMFPVGQQCGAAKGDHCSANPITAKASAQVVFNEDQVVVKVSANESTPCQLCSSLDCGAHGSCKAVGPNIHCVCADGYSGEHCEVPPEICYGVDCSNAGVCVTVHGANGPYGQCACLPGYSGSACQYESSGRRRTLSSSYTSSPPPPLWGKPSDCTAECDQSGLCTLGNDDMCDTWSDSCPNDGEEGAVAWEEMSSSIERSCSWTSCSYGGCPYGEEEQYSESCGWLSPNREYCCEFSKRVTCCPKLACSKDAAPLSSPPPPAIIFDEGLVDIAVTKNGNVGYYFVSTPASYSKAQGFCEDHLNGELLTVESEAELVSSGVAVAREFFRRNSETSSLQYWMGYTYKQGSWLPQSGDVAYIREKLNEAAGAYKVFYTGDCAFHDIMRGEDGIMSYGSCSAERSFVCKSANVQSASIVPFSPLTPPPPPSPSPPISPPHPFPPLPAAPPAQQRSSCYIWRMLSAPPGANPVFMDAHTVDTEIQGITQPGTYTLSLTVADSKGNQDSTIISTFIDFLSPPPSTPNPPAHLSPSPSPLPSPPPLFLSPSPPSPQPLIFSPPPSPVVPNISSPNAFPQPSPAPPSPFSLPNVSDPQPSQLSPPAPRPPSPASPSPAPSYLTSPSPSPPPSKSTSPSPSPSPSNLTSTSPSPSPSNLTSNFTSPSPSPSPS